VCRYEKVKVEKGKDKGKGREGKGNNYWMKRYEKREA
jgi:hypothetical protein